MDSHSWTLKSAPYEGPYRLYNQAISPMRGHNDCITQTKSMILECQGGPAQYQLALLELRISPLGGAIMLVQNQAKS